MAFVLLNESFHRVGDSLVELAHRLSMPGEERSANVGSQLHRETAVERNKRQLCCLEYEPKRIEQTRLDRNLSEERGIPYLDSCLPVWRVV